MRSYAWMDDAELTAQKLDGYGKRLNDPATATHTGKDGTRRIIETEQDRMEAQAEQRRRAELYPELVKALAAMVGMQRTQGVTDEEEETIMASVDAILQKCQEGEKP